MKKQKLKCHVDLTLPREFSWISAALESKVRQLWEQSGLVMAPNQLAALILANALDPKEQVPKSSPPKLVNQKKVTVVFDDDTMWLLRALERLVETKRSLGISPKTNHAKELIRLASNGYKRELVGAELDRIILNAATESDEG